MASLSALPIRAIEPAEFDAFADTVQLAFSGHDNADEREVDRRLLEYDRTLAAYDGDSIVGTAGAFSLEMTVPGGPAPVAGVTIVGVAPTHRRRRVLTSLMTRQLTDLHEQGREPVAALWASEPAIYGRFGYGLASQHLNVTVSRAWSAFLPSATAGTGALRIEDPAKSQPELDRVYEGVRQGRAGHFARSAGFWELRLFDPERHREGSGPLTCVLHEGAGSVDGYALFATKPQWTDGAPDGTVSVREVVAATPVAQAALWRFLLDIDLMSRVSASMAVDDPLLHLLTDPRRAIPRLSDNLWVRVVDVQRALTARRYAGPLDVVLQVEDAACSWNTGRWRLAADSTGATCTSTTDATDLALTSTELGAAYLGGTSLAVLAAAGRVQELRPGSLARASVAFGTGGRAPYCPQVF
jgi:predicted acetyltransferase